MFMFTTDSCPSPRCALAIQQLRGWFIFDMSHVLEEEKDFPPSIVSVSSYPKNINMVATYYEVINNIAIQEVAIHFTMSLLPKDLMKPRVQDDRIGYFATIFQDVGIHAHDEYLSSTSTDMRVAFIHRWRLEKNVWHNTTHEIESHCRSHQCLFVLACLLVCACLLACHVA
jgi:hypothetical protein